MKARIMTFNTQHCASYKEGLKINFPIFSAVIAKYGADVVGLNEIRSVGKSEDYKDQTAILAEGAGYPYYLFGEAIRFGGVNPYGNALLSKHKIKKSSTVLIPDPTVRAYNGYYETRSLCKARLECGLTVISVHVGLNPDERENAVRIILDSLEKEKCILMGDFNMEPDDPILAPIKARLFDTGSVIKGNSLTFPSDAPTRKIDYIFTTPDITVEGAFVPSDVVSDHLPLIADITFQGEINEDLLNSTEIQL